MSSYAIRYERTAKHELSDAQDIYGQTFREDTNRWLDELSSRVGEETDHSSVDLLELLEEARRVNTNSWRHTWRRFMKSTLLEKVTAILLVMKGRIPWKLRAAARRFTVINCFDCEIIAFFEVDHVGKKIVFRLFDGLPGQE